jgi:hypothetical protein
MSWPGVTKEQYDALRPIVRWETDVPDGAHFHTAYFDGGGIKVVDVWDSPADFDRFFETRLMPGIQQVGIAGQPDVQWYDAHAVFIPGVAQPVGA